MRVLIFLLALVVVVPATMANAGIGKGELKLTASTSASDNKSFGIEYAPKGEVVIRAKDKLNFKYTLGTAYGETGGIHKTASSATFRLIYNKEFDWGVAHVRHAAVFPVGHVWKRETGKPNAEGNTYGIGYEATFAASDADGSGKESGMVLTWVYKWGTGAASSSSELTVAPFVAFTP